MNILTRWAKAVSPENPWSEYPRPQMKRPDWVILNGLWKYCIVSNASGRFDQGDGDCKSVHVYFKKLPVINPEKKRAAIKSEFGGYSLKVNCNQWNPGTEFGYKKFTSIENLADAYLELLEKELKPCIEAGLSAAIYTQTTDVEIEVNGYLTYDREIEKMDFRRKRIAHTELLEDRKLGMSIQLGYGMCVSYF